MLKMEIETITIHTLCHELFIHKTEYLRSNATTFTLLKHMSWKTRAVGLTQSARYTDLMLVQCWSNNEPTMGQGIVFAENAG